MIIDQVPNWPGRDGQELWRLKQLRKCIQSMVGVQRGELGKQHRECVVGSKREERGSRRAPAVV
ncbi:hypothetical protein PsorP6_009305 [Peronosclerospora sorghi]|uniref:Uncharacterized protein n=1 Tax=Peronosclerospora sorghi TaxID=230839 RepID=A0ACC0VZE9_9STRA|nr:hypothetical protein PsorP6_009305 [Peronosclerospora sorghi]